MLIEVIADNSHIAFISRETAAPISLLPLQPNRGRRIFTMPA